MQLIKKSRPPLVGVDISSSAVKVVQLSRTGTDYRVEHVGVEPLPPNAVVDRNIADGVAVGEAIRRALQRSGSRAKHAATAVPSSAAIIKTIPMAADASDDEIEAQIELDFPNYVPYPLEEVAFDFEPQAPEKAGDEMVKVVLAAARSEAVDARVAALEEAGLTARVMDVDVFAVENAYELILPSLRLPSNALVALADIGARNTVLHVMRNGRSIYSREQAFGGMQLTEEIMRRYGLSEQEANQAKRQGGLPEGYEAEFVEPFKQSLVQQIGRLLQFFYAGSEFNRVDHVLLAGGSALIPGLAGAVEEQLGLRASVANPLAQMSYGPKLSRDLLAQEAPTLLTACGLALRGFDP